jgi:hypothetical protein
LIYSTEGFFFRSIVATYHIQMYSDPTLIAVSSFCIQE